jgi:CS domain
MTDKLAPDSRHSVVHEGRVVYEWSQTLNDVDIYAPLPPGQIKAKMLFVDIERKVISFGLVGTDPYMKVCCWLKLWHTLAAGVLGKCIRLACKIVLCQHCAAVQ